MDEIVNNEEKKKNEPTVVESFTTQGVLVRRLEINSPDGEKLNQMQILTVKEVGGEVVYTPFLTEGQMDIALNLILRNYSGRD